MIMGPFVGRLISLLKNILSFYPEIVWLLKQQSQSFPQPVFLSEVITLIPG